MADSAVKEGLEAEVPTTNTTSTNASADASAEDAPASTIESIDAANPPVETIPTPSNKRTLDDVTGDADVGAAKRQQLDRAPAGVPQFIHPGPIM